MFQTPLSDAGSLSEGAAAFDVIAAGGPLSIDTGSDLGQLCWRTIPCQLHAFALSSDWFDLPCLFVVIVLMYDTVSAGFEMFDKFLLLFTYIYINV